MADTSPTAVQKVKIAAKSADHPKYSEMVQSAVATLKERGGSSRQKILKFIMSNYKVGEEKTVNTHLKKALCTGVKSGLFNQSKGTGASGSFRLSDAAKKAPAKPKKPAATKPTVKKVADKKVTKVKKPKSPAEKATKVKKPKVGKKTPAIKQTAKNAVAKKSTPMKSKTTPVKKAALKKAVKKTPKKVAKKTATK